MTTVPETQTDMQSTHVTISKKSKKVLNSGKKTRKSQSNNTEEHCLSNCRLKRKKIGKGMIKCCLCNVWYHHDCVKEAKDIQGPWNCAQCRELPKKVAEIHHLVKSLHDQLANMSKLNENLTKELSCKFLENDELKSENEALKRKLLHQQHEMDRKSIRQDMKPQMQPNKSQLGKNNISLAKQFTQTYASAAYPKVPNHNFKIDHQTTGRSFASRMSGPLPRPDFEMTASPPQNPHNYVYMEKAPTYNRNNRRQRLSHFNPVNDHQVEPQYDGSSKTFIRQNQLFKQHKRPNNIRYKSTSNQMQGYNKPHFGRRQQILPARQFQYLINQNT